MICRQLAFLILATAVFVKGRDDSPTGDSYAVEEQHIIPPWPPATSDNPSVRDLHNEYNNIFRRGNRNAASHLWSTFLLDRAPQTTFQRLEFFFRAFCAISGSPVRPSDYNHYRLTLTKLGGGLATGYMHYCCWPCVCDTQDFIRVDTLNVTTSDGMVKKQQVAVIGNPCDRAEQLDIPFYQPFGRGQTTLSASAPEVKCLPGGVLHGATMSDHGYVIIGMFFDAETDDNGVSAGSLDVLSDPTPGRISNIGPVVFQDEREWAEKCAERANNGYNSGMGEIFRQVCSISPISEEALQPPLALGTTETEIETKETQSERSDQNDSCTATADTTTGHQVDASEA